VASNAVLDECRIFYTDRMSESIVTAMEVISNRGGIVVFEPSSLGEKSLFDRAVHCATIVKFSGERLGGELLPLISEGDAFGIMTHGAGGLEIVRHGDSIWSAAIANTDVSDTSGSGDMVTVGLLDRLLDVAEDARSLTLECVLDGVARGQRLAAANCSFVGARGLFLEKGAVHARRALSAHGIDADL
jgi:fructokinase